MGQDADGNGKRYATAGYAAFWVSKRASDARVFAATAVAFRLEAEALAADAARLCGGFNESADKAIRIQLQRLTIAASGAEASAERSVDCLNRASAVARDRKLDQETAYRAAEREYRPAHEVAGEAFRYKAKACRSARAIAARIGRTLLKDDPLAVQLRTRAREVVVKCDEDKQAAVDGWTIYR